MTPKIKPDKPCENCGGEQWMQVTAGGKAPELSGLPLVVYSCSGCQMVRLFLRGS